MHKMIIDDSPETLEAQRQLAADVESGNKFIENLTKEQLESWDPLDDYNDELDYAPAYPYKWHATTREEKIMIGIDPDKKLDSTIECDWDTKEFIDDTNKNDNLDCGGFENE